jgi:osmoprotectant transport system ATP-binding protein
MIVLSQVVKKYAERTVVDNVDLTIATSKTCVLIGTSGCGKSTILKLLIGLITPTSGDILWDNKPLAELEPKNARGRIGYVIQSGGLFPHLTVEENLSLPAQYRGWEKRKIQSRIAELVELTQFPGDGLSRYPVQLSGGQRQRVGLIRALMLDPDVLLLDEPLGALDPMVRSQLQEELLKIFRQLRKTVVLVTHDLHEAALFADQLVLMRHGQIIQQGVVQEFLDTPATAFVSDFIRAQRHSLPAKPVENLT